MVLCTGSSLGFVRLEVLGNVMVVGLVLTTYGDSSLEILCMLHVTCQHVLDD